MLALIRYLLSWSTPITDRAINNRGRPLVSARLKVSNLAVVTRCGHLIFDSEFSTSRRGIQLDAPWRSQSIMPIPVGTTGRENGAFLHRLCLSLSLCHSCGSRNPNRGDMDSRLRGNDKCGRLVLAYQESILAATIEVFCRHRGSLTLACLQPRIASWQMS